MHFLHFWLECCENLAFSTSFASGGKRQIAEVKSSELNGWISDLQQPIGELFTIFFWSLFSILSRLWCGPTLGEQKLQLVVNTTIRYLTVESMHLSVSSCRCKTIDTQHFCAFLWQGRKNPHTHQLSISYSQSQQACAVSVALYQYLFTLKGQTMVVQLTPGSCDHHGSLEGE